MKITQIHLENLLSFGKGSEATILRTNDINYIVGPNNAGKTNVIRAIGYFFNAMFNNHPTIIPDMLRFGNSMNPFYIKITFKLDKEQKMAIYDFFKLHGVVTGKEIKISVQEDNMRKQQSKTLSAPINISENQEIKFYSPDDEEKKFLDFWTTNYQRFVEYLIKDNCILFVLEYRGNPRESPKLYIQISEKLCICDDGYIEPLPLRQLSGYSPIRISDIFSRHSDNALEFDTIIKKIDDLKFNEKYVFSFRETSAKSDIGFCPAISMSPIHS